MNFENVLYEKKDNGILHIALNRPDVRNALTMEMWAEIRASFRAAKFDREVKVVILSGKGGKAFAGGVDIKVLKDRPTLQMLLIESQEILNEIENLNKPVIAAIDGFALGGGCEMAMACDIRIATKKSKFGQPEVNLGLIPGAGGTQRLQRLVGLGRAKELIFTAAVFDAQRAEQIGLVNQVVEDSDALIQAAEEMALLIIQKGPMAVSMSKMAINGYSSGMMNTGFIIEKLAQTVAFGTEDRIEGTSAFLEKRTAEFKGK